MTPQYVLRLDAKRRPTLPAALLAEAALKPDSELIARADGAGRIVLETAEAVKRRVRDRAVAGRARTGRTESAVDSLLVDRATDRSTPSITT